ncbi:tRNA pseudouridine(13) synthase TruD [Candidatus Woesearchaeota archaeon]|nr:tRNA pseudouridine(13) synthase TruD [Candidatus Woesearchaeota archaeon]
MFKFKQTPEDFIVREVSDEDTLKFISNPIPKNISHNLYSNEINRSNETNKYNEIDKYNETNKYNEPNQDIDKDNVQEGASAFGEYSYYKLIKKNCNTIDAITRIANHWNIYPKFINFAGTKDKNALTEQLISIKKGPKKGLFLDNIELKYLGQGNERINLGCLKGNEFEIIVESDNSPREMVKTINYFDDQRFGVNNDNHIIGKLLLQRKFNDVCKTLKLVVEANNYVGALRTINKRVLLLYLHAYQSYLWNETVKEFIKHEFIKGSDKYFEIEYALGELFIPEEMNTVQNHKIPLIGFGVETDNEVIRDILNALLVSEGISFSDFVIREMPEISCVGEDRNLLVDIENLKIEEMETEKKTFKTKLLKTLKNFKKIFSEQKPEIKEYKLSFFLNKGSYGTIVLKSLFG